MARSCLLSDPADDFALSRGCLNLSERLLRPIALGRANWGVIVSETGGETAALLYSVVQTCKHLEIDPFSYLREALPALFDLGEKPSAEQLVDWLPDRWLIRTPAAKEQTPPSPTG